MARMFERLAALAIALALLAAPLLSGSIVRAQDSPPSSSPISCEPETRPAPDVVRTVTPPADSLSTDDLTTIKVGYVPITVVAPIYVAKELGYFAEEGLDVQLEAFPGGPDLVILTASGQLDGPFARAGPPPGPPTSCASWPGGPGESPARCPVPPASPRDRRPRGSAGRAPPGRPRRAPGSRRAPLHEAWRSRRARGGSRRGRRALPSRRG